MSWSLSAKKMKKWLQLWHLMNRVEAMEGGSKVNELQSPCWIYLWQKVCWKKVPCSVDRQDLPRDHPSHPFCFQSHCPHSEYLNFCTSTTTYGGCWPLSLVGRNDVAGIWSYSNEHYETNLRKKSWILHPSLDLGFPYSLAIVSFDSWGKSWQGFGLCSSFINFRWGGQTSIWNWIFNIPQSITDN